MNINGHDLTQDEEDLIHLTQDEEDLIHDGLEGYASEARSQQAMWTGRSREAQFRKEAEAAEALLAKLFPPPKP